MTEFDWKYQDLVRDILFNGNKRMTRNGEVKSLFAKTLSLNVRYEFPILTLKEVRFRSVVGELLWFLNGKTDLGWLLERGVNIWNGDAYKHFLKARKEYDGSGYCACKNNWGKCECPEYTMSQFAQLIQENDEFNGRFGDFGPIYGYQWRNKESDWDEFVDQIAKLIEGIKKDPYSRRHLVVSWAADQIDAMVLPPCHYAFQVYINKDNMDMLVNIRSSDVPLGLPFNVSSYALLLHILCELTGYIPNQLTFVLGDAHIYENQVEAMETIFDSYSDYTSPTLMIDADFKSLDAFLKTADIDKFQLKGYLHKGKLSIPLSN